MNDISKKERGDIIKFVRIIYKNILNYGNNYISWLENNFEENFLKQS